MIIRQARPVFNRASLNARQNSRGLILSYKVIGERAQGTEDPPIMIFHALLGHKKTWEPIAKTFNTMTSRAVVVVDLRNHGESPHTNTHRFVVGCEYEDLFLHYSRSGNSCTWLIIIDFCAYVLKPTVYVVKIFTTMIHSSRSMGSNTYKK